MVTLDEGGWAESWARLTAPPAALEPYIDHVFTIDFRAADQRSWKVLPDTCGHLLVEMTASGGVGRVSVVGARRVAVEIDVARRAWTVGARFRPGALAALAGPAGKLTDWSATAGATWGAVGDHFEADIRRATDPAFVQRHLARFLQDRVASSPPPDWRAVGFGALVRRSGGRTGIGEAAARMGLSPRGLRDAATAFLGLPPKRYARIHRLFRALQLGRTTTWARVAAACGFADQSHLVRDFRDLLGETPAEYVARGRPVPIRSSPSGGGGSS